MIKQLIKRPKFKDLILYEDDDYIIINKPPFLASLKDRSYPTNILDLARGYIQSVQACHRLDKETSGVMALAKSSEAYRHLAQQFEYRTVIKNYRAVVPGLHQFRDYHVEERIRVLAKGLVKLDPVQGKQATTVLDSITAYRKHTLINCRPLTGRMHQIRVHLAFLEAPIIGDIAYGGQHFFLSEIKHRFNLKKHTEELPIIRRVALHAHSIEFKLLSGIDQEFEAPPPKDFAVLIKQLEKNC